VPAFPKKNRVLKRSDFLAFFEGSDVRRFGPCLIFRISNDRGIPRLGLTIKAKKSSVTRNQIKRTIRDVFRKCSDRLGSYDYNIVVNAFGPKSPFKHRQDLCDQVRLQLETAWSGPNVLF